MRSAPGTMLWQRDYYEHTVRGTADLDRIRRYIAENPVRWSVKRGETRWYIPELSTKRHGQGAQQMRALADLNIQ